MTSLLFIWSLNPPLPFVNSKPSNLVAVNLWIRHHHSCGSVNRKFADLSTVKLWICVKQTDHLQEYNCGALITKLVDL